MIKIQTDTLYFFFSVNSCTSTECLSRWPTAAYTRRPGRLFSALILVSSSWGSSRKTVWPLASPLASRTGTGLHRACKICWSTRLWGPSQWESHRSKVVHPAKVLLWECRLFVRVLASLVLKSGSCMAPPHLYYHSKRSSYLFEGSTGRQWKPGPALPFRHILHT